MGHKLNVPIKGKADYTALSNPGDHILVKQKTHPVEFATFSKPTHPKLSNRKITPCNKE
jgi:hypothetical protein